MSELRLTRDLPDGPFGPACAELLPQQRAFVLYYTLGEDDIRGVAYKSYMAAYPNAGEAGAKVNSSYLLKNEKVRKAVDEIRKEIEREFRSKMKSWAGMALDAQLLLERHIETALHPEQSRAQGTNVSLDADDITVIKEVLDRALGKPKQPHEHDIGDKLDNMLRTIAAKRRVPALASGPSDAQDAEFEIIADTPPPEVDDGTAGNS